MTSRRFAALAATSLVMVSCATTEAGTATPVETAGDVPRVSAPLDPTPYLDDPCSLVPGDEPAQLGYEKKPKKRSSEVSGPSCSWPAKTKGGTLLVSIQTENTKRGAGGMQGIYDAYHVRHWFSYYEPTEVSGYPAAYSDGGDMRAHGETALRVGITDDLTFSVTIGPLGDGKQKEAEDGARTVAEAVIATLKAGR